MKAEQRSMIGPAANDFVELSELAASAPVEDVYEETSTTAKESPIDRANIPNKSKKQHSTLSKDNHSSKDDCEIPEHFANLNEIRASSLVENTAERHQFPQEFLEDIRSHEEDAQREPRRWSLENGSQETSSPNVAAAIPHAEQTSKILAELYTLSYLVLFSILGTLARLGIIRLTIYPGNPVTTGALWANFGGSLIMGFLSEDRKFFFKHIYFSQASTSSEDATSNELNQADPEANNTTAQKVHMTIKKTIPLYIGVTTGFCGSLTSFSTFIRDVFLALSNNTATIISTHKSSTVIIPRNGDFSFMAFLATIILTLCLYLSALKVGAHLAIAAERITPALPVFFTHKILDRAVAVLAWLIWLGAIILAIWPPDRPSGPAADGRTSRRQETWRGWVLFALVFSAVGCISRFYASLFLNSKSLVFTVGTFIVNVFGTVMLGVAWDLQHAPLGSAKIGGGVIGCQVLQGVQDGFCGCLTTVSTWFLELSSLKRRHAYIYGAISIGASLTSLIVIMGSLGWTKGFKEPVCSL